MKFKAVLTSCRSLSVVSTLILPLVSISEGIPCLAQNDQVKVSVFKSTENQTDFDFAVTNVSKSPIELVAVSLGDSDHEELHSIADNIPNTFRAPKDWRGEVRYTDESTFMRLAWLSKKPVKLGPQETLGGFGLVMPVPVPKMKKGIVYHLYNEPVTAVDWSKAAFNVFYKDGSCFWGYVTPNE